MTTVSLVNYDAIGFDVDQTLAKYHIPHLFNVVHDGLVDYLITNRDWDKSLKEPFAKHKDFCTRGLVFDMKHGNFLKLGQDGHIIRVSHGTRFLSDAEICTVYGEARHWVHTDQLISRVDNSSDNNYRIFDNFFDCIGTVALARMVDIVNDRMKKNNASMDDYRFVWEDLLAAYDDVYRYQAFKEDTGAFFPQFKRETSKFLHPCSSETKDWLRRLHQHGTVLFLMTSSFADFAQATLEFIFGDDWQSYFDVVLTRARKPGFFFNGSKFLQMNGTVEGNEVESLQKGQIYSQGNMEDLMAFFKTTTGRENPKVAYFGDSLRSDIYPSKQYAGWDTVFILEEMQAESPLTNHQQDNSQAANQTGDESKKPQACPVPQLECECLTSHCWGSIFTDERKVLTNGVMELAPEINTLWGYIIRKYADLTIPTIEHITGFPLDHKFPVFNHEDPNQLGFYPECPAALQSRKS